jgi:hypothetical protein
MVGSTRTRAFVAGFSVVIVFLASAGANSGGHFVAGRRTSRVSTVTTSASSVSTPNTEPDCRPEAPERVKTPHLPWPVEFTTSCGRYMLQNGRVTRLPLLPALDSRYRVRAGDDAWAEVQVGHVVFTSRGRVVWRSAGETYDPQALGAAVLGPGWVAFSSYEETGGSSDLFLSARLGAERKVAENEEPLVAGTSGDLIVSKWYPNGANPDLVVRQPDGELSILLATGISASYSEPASGTLLYLRGRTVWRTDGSRSWPVVRMAELGVPGLEWVDRLEDGRILLTGRRSLGVLTPNGRMIEHATLARISKGGSGYVNVVGSFGRTGLVPSVNPTTGGLILLQAVWLDANAGGGKGWEGVYELPQGASRARLLFGKPLKLAVCAHESSVSWRQTWLLYRACEGRAVAIDTTGRHSAIDLTAVARSMPMPEEEREYGLLAAQWSAERPSWTSSTSTPLNPRG